jgi:hypothetical protein
VALRYLQVRGRQRHDGPVMQPESESNYFFFFHTSLCPDHTVKIMV